MDLESKQRLWDELSAFLLQYDGRPTDIILTQNRIEDLQKILMFIQSFGLNPKLMVVNGMGLDDSLDLNRFSFRSIETSLTSMQSVAVIQAEMFSGIDLHILLIPRGRNFDLCLRFWNDSSFINHTHPLSVFGKYLDFLSEVRTLRDAFRTESEDNWEIVKEMQADEKFQVRIA